MFNERIRDAYVVLLMDISSERSSTTYTSVISQYIYNDNLTSTITAIYVRTKVFLYI